MNSKTGKRTQLQFRRWWHIMRLVISRIVLFVMVVSITAARHPPEQVAVLAPKPMLTKEMEATIKYVPATTTIAAPELVESSYIESMDLDAKECYLLAKIAMAEAESEDTEGKALIILTVLNRVWASQFPNTIEEVIIQENAFTSYHNGRWDCVEPDADCKAALELVKGGWDGSQGALYFERMPEDRKSTWHSRNLKKLFTHGNHTFYKEKEAGE